MEHFCSFNSRRRPGWLGRTNCVDRLGDNVGALVRNTPEDANVVRVDDIDAVVGAARREVATDHVGDQLGQELRHDPCFVTLR